jgi:hypothetical protein
MDLRTFTVAGISTQNSQTKVRFANDLVSRIKLFEKGNHQNLNMVSLPEPMDKISACKYLLTLPDFAKWTSLIQETLAKKESSVKTTKKTQILTNTTKNVSEEFDNLEEYVQSKELTTA